MPTNRGGQRAAEDDLVAVVTATLTKAQAAKLTAEQTAAAVVSRLRKSGRTADTAEVRAGWARLVETVRTVAAVPGPLDRQALGDGLLELWEDALGLDSLKALQARIARRITEGGW